MSTAITIYRLKIKPKTSIPYFVYNVITIYIIKAYSS